MSHFEASGCVFLTCGGKCIIVDQRTTLVQKKWNQILCGQRHKKGKRAVKIKSSDTKNTEDNKLLRFTLKFRKRNLTSASSCDTLLVFVTFSIPSVPLFRRGLVQPHNIDTSSRLRSSTDIHTVTITSYKTYMHHLSYNLSSSHSPHTFQ